MSAFSSSLWRRSAAAAGVATLVLAATPLTADAASVTRATFSGGAGTFTDLNGTVYARAGAGLSLHVVVDSTTKCVKVTSTDGYNAFQSGAAGQTSYTFPVTGGTGDGAVGFTVAAHSNSNTNGCTGNSSTLAASYTRDNTGPVVTGTASPTPQAGWNKSNVTVTWSATDTGSGVASGPTPGSASVNQNTNVAGQVLGSTATDRLGNLGSGSIVVKLDKVAPSITAHETPAANAAGWNNTDVMVSYECSDSLSGIATCPAATTLTSSGTASAQASDIAGNTATASRTVKIDKAAPQLSGIPATAPDGTNGWYTHDVRIDWQADDALSGLAGGLPVPSMITGEGTGLTASASVSDNAGNTTTARSAPDVKIDRTAPVTAVSAPSGWTSTAATVRLSSSDNLSGVAATHYSVDGGPALTYDAPFTLDEGDHTLSYWAVDSAGNAEATKSTQVRVDSSAPVIGHRLSPVANANGWHNGAVSVTFSCSDDLSGVTACGPDATVDTEGADQQVHGSATDAAGNTATDTVTVNLDKTAPTIAATTDRPANGNGWYADDVAVSFQCSDDLSGIGVLKGGTDCPDTVLLGEGADQTAGGAVADAAGNVSSDHVRAVNVDKTPPSLNGTASASGWVDHDVSVAWTCSDLLSGIDTVCPSPTIVGGEGGNLSASIAVRDRAGNEAVATVGGISIDRTAPSTTAVLPAAPESGWYRGPVSVSLAGHDPLSGVAATYYSLDGGASRQYAGAFEVGQAGAHAVTFWSVDVAGNLERGDAPGQTVRFRVDDVAPSIEGGRSAANAQGWNNGPVQVSFTCGDEHSGVDGVCGPDATVSGEGGGQSVTGHVRDIAGNAATATVDDINIDTTAPQLSGAATTAANEAGWYNHDVRVEWRATDALSGISPADEPEPGVVDTEGVDQAVRAVVRDRAGNEGVATVGGISIDKTAPSVEDAGPSEAPNGNNGWYTRPVANRFLAADSGSGLSAWQMPLWAVSTGTQEGSSVRVLSGAVSDLAGNHATASSAAFKVDLTDPTRVTMAGGPLDGSTYTTLSLPDRPSCTAVDGVSGMAGCLVTGYGTTVGTHTLTATATDNAGRTTRVVRTYTVKPAYTAKGLFAPVDMGTTVNTVKGGSTVPLKFEVFEGSTELTATSIVQDIKYARTSCDASLATDAVETTSTGGTSLRYDTLSGQYVYNWQTPKTVGSCYVVTVSVNEGPSLSALFKTK